MPQTQARCEPKGLDIDLLRAPSIKISMEAYSDMFTWVGLAANEVSGLGHARVTDDGDILIYKIVLLRQAAGATHATLDDMDVAAYMQQIMEQEDSLTNLCVWWHSHASFKTYWSGTDENTIARFMGQSPWLISIVVNKAHSVVGRLDLRCPPITLNGLNVSIDHQPVDTKMEELTATFQEKVFEGLEVDRGKGQSVVVVGDDFEVVNGRPVISDEDEGWYMGSGGGRIRERDASRRWRPDGSAAPANWHRNAYGAGGQAAGERHPGFAELGTQGQLGYGNSRGAAARKVIHQIPDQESFRELLETVREEDGTWSMCVVCGINKHAMSGASRHLGVCLTCADSPDIQEWMSGLENDGFWEQRTTFDDDITSS